MGQRAWCRCLGGRARTGSRSCRPHRSITAAFVAKASPQENCYVERFSGSMRDELLDGEEFHSVTEARVVITGWIETYNTARPHCGLRMKAPAQFLFEYRGAGAVREDKKGGL